MFKSFFTIILIVILSFGFISTDLSILAQEIEIPDSLVEIEDEHDHTEQEVHAENESELTQLSETKFDKEVTAFFLYGTDFASNKIFIKTINFKNQESEFVEAFADNESFGEESAEIINTRSGLFYFEEGVESVKVFSKNNIEGIQVKIIQTKSEQAFSPQAVPYAGLKQKSYYSNLNIQLKVREEWGVPRLTEWELAGGDRMAPWQAHDINKIVIHHTATSSNNSDPAAAIRAIYNDHKDRCENGGVLGVDCSEVYETWQDIGYNFIIDQNGTIYEGRSGGDSVVGAHSRPNYGTIGIALIGNFNSTMPNDSVKNALKNLIVQLSELHDFEPDWGTTVLGHRDRLKDSEGRPLTDCPGHQLYSFLPAIIDEAKDNFSISSRNTELSNLRKQLYVGRTDLMQVDQSVSLMINVDSISLIEKTFLEQNLYTASTFRTINEHYIFTVDDDYVSKILKDVKLFFPNAQIQPVYIKQLNAVWTDAGGRATTDNYDADDLWYLEKIEAPEAWSELGGCQGDELCGGDPGVVIAMIDTGVAYEDYDYDAGSYDYPNSIENIGGLNIEVPDSDTPNNIYNEGYDRQYEQAPELANVNFVDPYDVTQDFLCSWRSGSAYPCNASELEKIDHANDDDGHGTFGTIIMAGDPLGPRDGMDNSESDLIGIAHNVSVMPIKAFFPNDNSMCYEPDGDHDPNCSSPNENLKGVTFTFLLTEAIEYAVTNDADIINMSLGGGGADPALQSAINDAYNNGVTVIAASGNTNSNVNNFYPAAYNNVIAVGASTPTDQRASYSNYGSKLDVVAPVGDGIPSQWFGCSDELDSDPDACFRETEYTGGGGTGMFQEFSNGESPGINLAAGTSFAAPQVSAAAALIKSRYPSATPLEIENTLKTTATDILAAGKDDQSGYGVINVDEALQNLWTSPAGTPIYRFFNYLNGSHFYTNKQSERDKLLNDLDTYFMYEYEGDKFSVVPEDELDSTPVYRFFNSTNGAHFYTISLDERDKILNEPEFESYEYEGIKFYVYKISGSGRKAVYRFFNTSNGSHLYTTSTSERDKILNDSFYDFFEYEGIKFYVL
jgi:subtilisin family serine protease